MIKIMQLALKETKINAFSFVCQTIIQAGLIAIAMITVFYAAAIPKNFERIVANTFSKIITVTVDEINSEVLNNVLQGTTSDCTVTKKDFNNKISILSNESQTIIPENYFGVVLKCGGNNNFFTFNDKLSIIDGEFINVNSKPNNINLIDILATQIGAKVEDTITIKSNNQSFQVVVSGIYQSTDLSTAMPFIIPYEIFSNNCQFSDVVFFNTETASVKTMFKNLNEYNIEYQDRTNIGKFIDTAYITSIILLIAFMLIAVFTVLIAFKNFLATIKQRKKFIGLLNAVGMNSKNIILIYVAVFSFILITATLIASLIFASCFAFINGVVAEFITITPDFSTIALAIFSPLIIIVLIFTVIFTIFRKQLKEMSTINLLKNLDK